mmetsp:Transcript_29928/g.45604  ORF Transcript_29928/g.45604 Transcript_29928/m.45604 type:complete len:111 (-) Transcript_29928:24-356(-)
MEVILALYGIFSPPSSTRGVSQLLRSKLVQSPPIIYNPTLRAFAFSSWRRAHCDPFLSNLLFPSRYDWAIASRRCDTVPLSELVYFNESALASHAAATELQTSGLLGLEL